MSSWEISFFNEDGGLIKKESFKAESKYAKKKIVKSMTGNVEGCVSYSLKEIDDEKNK